MYIPNRKLDDTSLRRHSMHYHRHFWLFLDPSNAPDPPNRQRWILITQELILVFGGSFEDAAEDSRPQELILVFGGSFEDAAEDSRPFDRYV